jgi:hypothetical protein
MLYNFFHISIEKGVSLETSHYKFSLGEARPPSTALHLGGEPDPDMGLCLEFFGNFLVISDLALNSISAVMWLIMPVNL